MNYDDAIGEVFVGACVDLRDAAANGRNEEAAAFSAVASAIEAAYPRQVQRMKDGMRGPAHTSPEQTPDTALNTRESTGK